MNFLCVLCGVVFSAQMVPRFNHLGNFVAATYPACPVCDSNEWVCEDAL